MAELAAPEGIVTDTELPARPDVFLSYAREDVEVVRLLTTALAERGKSAWVDWQDIPPTAEWLAEIYTGVEAADAFVAVMSPDSLSSDICALELAHAVEHNKRIVPLLRHEAGPIPVPPDLEAPNWIFIRAEDDFDSAVETLVTALETDLDWVRAHTRLLTRAIEWRSRGEDRSLLLSGSDLREAEGWLAQHDGKKEPAPTALQRQYLLASRRAAARRQRILLVAVVIALTITGVLAVLAVLQRNEAVAQAKTAESRALAASAVAQLPADPELSVLLAAEAARVARTTEAEAALRLALPQSLVVAAAPAHDERVNTVEFSQDGRYVLSAADDGVAVVWDWRAGKQAGRLRVQPPPGEERGAPTTEERLTAGFSPDGSSVLAAALDETLLWRWQSNTKQELGAEMPFGLATFATDDYLVLPVYSDQVGGRQEIRVFDLAGDAADSVVLGEIEMSGPEYVDFDPEHGLVLLADLAGDVAILEWETGGLTELNALADADGATDGVPLTYDAALSRDGIHLAVAASDGTAQVWDWRAGRQVMELGGHSSTVSSVAFSSDGELLLTGSWDGTARVWNWRQRQEVAVLRGHRGWVTSAAFSRDGEYVVTGGADGSVRVWAIARQRSLVSLAGDESGVVSLDVTADGRWILTATTEFTGESEEERLVSVWDRDRAEVAAELRWPPEPFGDYALGIEAAFSRDGSRVVAVDGSGGSVWVWDWGRTAELSRPVSEPGRDVAPLATVDGLLTHAAFSRDGSFVAAATADGFVRVWRWREGELVAELAPEGAQKGALPRLPLQSVAFSADGRYLVAAGATGRAWVWDWRAGTIARELRPGGSLRAAVFSPDGRLVATAGDDGAVWVYDWRQQRVVADLRHGEGVNDVEFSPDGKLLLSGSSDGTARVWDWEAERPVLELPDHPSWVTAVAFAAGGRTIVTGGADGAARLFSCSVCGPLTDLEALVPKRVTRGLTPEERARYLP